MIVWWMLWGRELVEKVVMVCWEGRVNMFGELVEDNWVEMGRIRFEGGVCWVRLVGWGFGLL